MILKLLLDINNPYNIINIMSKVYFIDFSKVKMNLKLLKKSLDMAGAKEIVTESSLVSVKMHFGEMGNIAYIKPAYINYICDYIKGLGGKPFITDTNTLYKGMRSNTVDHLNNAFFNGFGNHPLVIADGMRGESFVEIKSEGDIFKSLFIAADIFYSDVLFCVSHFKGHDLTGFGGAIKNMGMGCAARKGKLAMHSSLCPSIDKEKCIGCFECIKWCESKAIERINKKAFINSEKCIGCGLCIDVCKYGAIKIKWDTESSDIQRRIAEYASGAIKKGRTIFVNIINDVSPQCDCYSYNGHSLVNDIGLLVSTDIVAIDEASYNLVNERSGRNVFKEVHKKINPEIQLEHAEKIGIGKREYNLINVS